ncbi:MAG TPA: gamma-glutamyltransferase, partial [Beutenbergiaceae bacterium]|nr:gamma-glutamyltransferase [Beutenbergiaceae bacterium]
ALHLQIEAMKLAFADAYRYIADPAAMEIDYSALLAKEYLASRAALIDPARAQDPGYGTPPRAGTVYLSAADQGGMMVSFIQSNFQGFGSGIVVPGTGIALQNRGAGFTLEEGHPNVVAGSKLPYHTIIPGFLMRDGMPLGSFGVMGGFMQPQGHMQLVVRLETYGQDPQAAMDAPRWQVLEGLKVAVEEEVGQDVIQELRARGHDVEVDRSPYGKHFFGGGQLIVRSGEAYVGVSDFRREGQAVGF